MTELRRGLPRKHPEDDARGRALAVAHALALAAGGALSGLVAWWGLVALAAAGIGALGAWPLRVGAIVAIAGAAWWSGRRVWGGSFLAAALAAALLASLP